MSIIQPPDVPGILSQIHTNRELSLKERTAGARGRIRRVMIVALARKLLIALWRFSETGLVPTGAKLG